MVALLNDLFGIQSRGGCSCAGPYGHRLLGIDLERSHEFEREIARGSEGIKPGWVRVNFNYFISEAVFEFILGAVEIVASDGWRLLPHYRFEPGSGLWSHAGGTAEPPMSLRDIAYAGGRMTYPSHHRTEPESRLADYLAEARRILADLPAPARTPEHLVVDADFETLRWFPLPDDVPASRETPPPLKNKLLRTKKGFGGGEGSGAPDGVGRDPGRGGGGRYSPGRTTWTTGRAATVAGTGVGRAVARGGVTGFGATTAFRSADGAGDAGSGRRVSAAIADGRTTVPRRMPAGSQRSIVPVATAAATTGTSASRTSRSSARARILTLAPGRPAWS